MKTGLALLAIAVAAIAQTTAPSRPAMVVAAGQFGGVMAGPVVGGNPLQPVVGRPYSAEQVTEHVQTLADGTHITQAAQTTKLYRDSAGRTRTEHIFTPPPGVVMASMPSFIQIADPVTGYRYMLDAHNQIARRAAWPPAMQRPNQVAPANQPRPAILTATSPANGAAPAARPRPDISHESLGTQTIEGVIADGTRITTTYPAGFMGNDRPITTVSESWFSPDLKMVVLSKFSDPRNGESTTKLTNVLMAEPDPSLFQVPSEYSIVDEPAPVIR